LVNKPGYWEGKSNLAGVPVAKMWVVPKKYKSESGNSTLLVRFDKGVVYELQPKEKTYSEYTFAEWDKCLKAKMAQMEAMCKRLDEKSEVASEDLKEPPPKMPSDSKSEMTDTGETKAIAGYECTKSVGKQDGKEVLLLWVTKDVEGYEEIRRDLQESFRLMSPAIGKGMSDVFSTLDGFVMEAEMDGSKNTVTKVEVRKIPAKEFEVPKDYVKETPPRPAGEGQEVRKKDVAPQVKDKTSRKAKPSVNPKKAAPPERN
jgi:hypothetical protein